MLPGYGLLKYDLATAFLVGVVLSTKQFAEFVQMLNPDQQARGGMASLPGPIQDSPGWMAFRNCGSSNGRHQSAVRP